MSVRPILLLGDPDLYLPSAPVAEEEIRGLDLLIRDLRDTLVDFRSRWGSGKAISAPQIGVRKRVVYILSPVSAVFINPVIEPAGTKVEVWENCLSFPGLFVRVSRYAVCGLAYRDSDWRPRSAVVTGEMSVIMQHECDHLDGILAVARAADGESFSLIPPRGWPRRP